VTSPEAKGKSPADQPVDIEAPQPAAAPGVTSQPQFDLELGVRGVESEPAELAAGSPTGAPRHGPPPTPGHSSDEKQKLLSAQNTIAGGFKEIASGLLVGTLGAATATLLAVSAEHDPNTDSNTTNARWIAMGSAFGTVALVSKGIFDILQGWRAIRLIAEDYHTRMSGDDSATLRHDQLVNQVGDLNIRMATLENKLEKLISLINGLMEKLAPAQT
jgi:hypothetical protein